MTLIILLTIPHAAITNSWEQHRKTGAPVTAEALATVVSEDPKHHPMLLQWVKLSTNITPADYKDRTG